MKRGELTDTQLLAYCLFNMGSKRSDEVNDFWEWAESDHNHNVKNGESIHDTLEEYTESWMKELLGYEYAE